MLDRFFVEILGLPLQAVRHDAIPCGGFTRGALAQHFAVVDLAHLDGAAGHGRQHARDATIGADQFGSLGEEQQKRAPRVRVGAGPDGQLADEMRVKERRQLGERDVDLRGRALVEQQRVGQHREAHRRELLGWRGRLDDAPERRFDGGVAVRIHHDDARGGLARAREFGEARCVVWRQRRWRRRVANVNRWPDVLVRAHRAE